MTWVGGGLDSTGVKVGLGDHKGLLQPSSFCDSSPLVLPKSTC